MIAKIMNAIKSSGMLQNIIGGIIAGFVVLILNSLYHWLKWRFIGRKFKNIFGCNDDYNIVYGLYNGLEIGLLDAS